MRKRPGPDTREAVSGQRNAAWWREDRLGDCRDCLSEDATVFADEPRDRVGHAARVCRKRDNDQIFVGQFSLLVAPNVAVQAGRQVAPGPALCVLRQAQHEGCLTAANTDAVTAILMPSLSKHAECRCKTFGRQGTILLPRIQP